MHANQHAFNGHGRSSYSATALNQSSGRTNAPGIDILGIANALATVTVSNQSTYRKGEFFQKALAINNAGGAVYPLVTNIATLSGVTNIEWGKVYVPPATESYIHDKDGNLTQDARWNYTWDAENRLINQEARNGSDPSTSIAHAYDYRSRRISIKVTETGGGLSTNRFIYNGWNVIAEFNGGGVLQKSFVWGKDLSGSEQGAGGVGGLVMLVLHTGGNSGTYFPAYDGNGNLITLWKGSESSSGIKARYEYDPFHNVLRATGDIAKENNHLAATKYYCWRSGQYYYGFRHYDPDTGRWLSNDPIGEKGGNNLFNFVVNQSISQWDYLGLTIPSMSARAHPPYPCCTPLSLTYDLSGDKGFRNALHIAPFRDGRFSSLTDAVKDARRRVTRYDPDPKKCRCINDLVIVSHGGEGSAVGQITFPDSSNDIFEYVPGRTPEEEQQNFNKQAGVRALQDISQLVCKGGRIEFTACFANGPDGDMKRLLRSALGVEVEVNSGMGRVCLGIPIGN